MELWKQVPKYSKYEVSDKGNVRKDCGSYYRILSPGVSGSGYKELHLYYKTSRIRKYVHRLVLELFVGPCPEGKQCCHKDGNKLNNSLYNLYWGTPENNCHDAIRHGTHSSLPKNRSFAVSSLTRENVLDMRELYPEYTYRELAEMYGISEHSVWRIVTKRRWKHV